MLRRVVTSHRQVRAFLGTFEGHGDWRRQLLFVLAALPEHFASEEVPEGFCDVVRRRLGDAPADALEQDHVTLLARAARLATLLGHDDPSLEAETRAFAEVLGAHERREAELALACERQAALSGGPRR